MKVASGYYPGISPWLVVEWICQTVFREVVRIESTIETTVVKNWERTDLCYWSKKAFIKNPEEKLVRLHGKLTRSLLAGTRLEYLPAPSRRRETRMI